MKAEPTGALARLVGDERRFAGEHWGRRPLLRERAGEFATLLDLPVVDHLVTETLMRLPGMRLVKGGAPVPPSRYTRTIRVGGSPVRETVRPERVVEEFARGATIVLQALHRQWGPVARFCRDLELDLTHPVQANAYATPATSRGFAVHHDTHDVFVIQTHGRKAWRVYEPLIELAGRSQGWSKALGDPGEPTIEAELAPGDVLYLPRGFPHDAETRDEVSVHVTVGVHARTWLDVWTHLMEEAAEHGPFREALPVAFARHPDALEREIGERLPELLAWLEKRAGGDAAASVVEGFWRTRRSHVAGRLLQVAALERLTPASRVRRLAAAFAVERDGQEVAAFLAGGRTLRMPAACEPALRFVGEADGGFAVEELPGLDRPSALVLVRRLVREGVLEVLDASG